MRTAGPGAQPISPSAAATGVPVRVIMIERSSGVQVGEGNVQVSAYRVTLPQASFESGLTLAETLLNPDAPWGRDVFSHDAEPRLPEVTVSSPQGDTLVVVRNSRGVQVGDRNVQHNEFRIRIRDMAVRAVGIGMTGQRQEWIARLHQDPGDWAAARLLADDLGRAARADLQADLTAQVRQITGGTQINRWAGELRDRVGPQVGGPRNRVRIKVNVNVTAFDRQALRRQLQNAAKDLDRAEAPSRPERPTESPRGVASRDTSLPREPIDTE